MVWLGLIPQFHTKALLCLCSRPSSFSSFLPWALIWSWSLSYWCSAPVSPLCFHFPFFVTIESQSNLSQDKNKERKKSGLERALGQVEGGGTCSSSQKAIFSLGGLNPLSKRLILERDQIAQRKMWKLIGEKRDRGQFLNFGSEFHMGVT